MTKKQKKKIDRDEKALAIGHHILDSFDSYVRKPLGLRLIVPVVIERKIVRIELTPEFQFTGIWE